MAVFSRLITVAASAFAIQLGLASFFVPRADDRFFDLSGAAGFLITTLVSIYHRSSPHVQSVGATLGRLAPRQLLLTAALVTWAGRLGVFLTRRAIKAGGDSRLNKIKHDKVKFTIVWIAQATWVFIVGLPVYLSNLLPASAHPSLHARDYAALTFTMTSFILEVTADHQKIAWRRARDSGQHDENYVGEVGIWTGMWALASFSGALPWQAVLLSAASPVGTYFLLRCASGVPPLETAGNRRFGTDPKWKEYKRVTPVFFPWGRYGEAAKSR